MFGPLPSDFRLLINSYGVERVSPCCGDSLKRRLMEQSKPEAPEGQRYCSHCEKLCEAGGEMYVSWALVDEETVHAWLEPLFDPLRAIVVASQLLDELEEEREIFLSSLYTPS